RFPPAYRRHNHRLPIRPAYPGAVLVLGPQGSPDHARLANLRGAAARAAHRRLAGPAGGLVGHLWLPGVADHLCGRQPVDVRLPQLRQVRETMNLLLLGFNQKTASLELREKLAGLIPDLPAAYRSLKDFPEIAEIILYSTCNRVELLCL